MKRGRTIRPRLPPDRASTMATRLFRLIAFLIAALFLAVPSAYAQADLTPLVDALGQGGFPQRGKAIDALVETGDQRVPPILQALSDGDLFVRNSDQKVVIAKAAASGFAITEPLDGTALGDVAKADLEKIKVNN